jgi:hypothetical protein
MYLHSFKFDKVLFKIKPKHYKMDFLINFRKQKSNLILLATFCLYFKDYIITHRKFNLASYSNVLVMKTRNEFLISFISLYRHIFGFD